MNDDDDNKRHFPCCDLLTEARLDGQELIHDLSSIVRNLENAARSGDYDDNKELCLLQAKAAKEAIWNMTNSLMRMRDKITCWQAWASDNSPLN